MSEETERSGFVPKVRGILEHGVMIGVSLLASLFLALLALFGIYLLD